MWMVIKYPFGWGQKLYYTQIAHLWILAFWTNDYSSLGLCAVRGCFPNTNFEPIPTIWTHGVNEKSCPRGPKAWEVLAKVTDFIQAAEEKCTEARKTKEVHAFGTCLQIKIHPNRFLREPLATVLTLALLSLKGYAHFWHLTLDTLTATGLMEEERICFAVKKKKKNVLRFLRLFEITPEKYWISAFLSSLRWCRKWCPPHVMIYFRASVFSRCSKPAGSWSFFKLWRW